MLSEQESPHFLLGNRGAALVTAIILAAVLITVALASLIYSRSDAMLSSNSHRGSEALWIAHLGTERVKNWLRLIDTATGNNNWENVTGSVTRHAAETYSGQVGSTYTTTVAPYGGVAGRFLIDSAGTSPEGSTARIQEVVAFAANALNAAAINIHGFGTHTKLEINNMDVPSYFVDGRDHDLHGTPCGFSGTTCGASEVPAIAGDSDVINNDVRAELSRLRERMITEGGGCNANGTNCDSAKTAGLYWASRRGLTTTGCAYGSAAPCQTALQLRAPEMNAVSHPSGSDPVYAYTPNSGNTPWANMFLGPIVGTPETQILSAADENILGAIIDQLLEFAVDADATNRRAITADLTTSQTFGTWEKPVIAVVCDPGHSKPAMDRLGRLDPCNGAEAPNVTRIDGSPIPVIDGDGILIVSRQLEIDDATFNWRGIVIVLDGGLIEVKATGGSADACGMILGTLLLQDGSGANPKIKFLDTANTACSNPFTGSPTPGYTAPADVTQIHGFGIKYSNDAIRNALSPATRTLAWNEVYTGE